MSAEAVLDLRGQAGRRAGYCAFTCRSQKLVMAPTLAGGVRVDSQSLAWCHHHLDDLQYRQ